MPNNAPIAAQLAFGRIFFGALCRESDALGALEGFCRREEIRAGLFSLTGTTRSAIVGTYDPKQQVYATRREEGAFDILLCTGTILPEAGHIAITARIVLCGERGVLTGGRLFSETPVDSGEFEIRELLGSPPERTFDPVSARIGLLFP